VDRRSFFKIGAAGLLLPVAAKLSPLEAAASPCLVSKDGKYNIVILGDTHFDNKDPERYHARYTDPKPSREANHRKEFVRNGEMWADRNPRLVKRAACLVDDKTKFIYQVGDLIQGDTADAEAHTRFLDDAFKYFKSDLAASLPFITVAGNHDLRGNDDKIASQAYKDYMVVQMSNEMNKQLDDINFSLRVGPDAFVAINYNCKDLPTIEKMIKEAEGARHMFLMIHTPVFPYEVEKCMRWIPMGDYKDSRSEERRYLRSLLARNNAIVLCGHTHWTEFIDWKGDGGRITQMTMSSVWTKEKQAEYHEKVSGPENYGNLIFSAHPELKEAVLGRVFDEYREGLQSYSRANSVGSYKLNVDGRHVTVDFYGGDSTRLTKRFILR